MNSELICYICGVLTGTLACIIHSRKYVENQNDKQNEGYKKQTKIIDRLEHIVADLEKKVENPDDLYYKDKAMTYLTSRPFDRMGFRIDTRDLTYLENDSQSDE